MLDARGVGCNDNAVKRMNERATLTSSSIPESTSQSSGVCGRTKTRATIGCSGASETETMSPSARSSEAANAGAISSTSERDATCARVAPTYTDVVDALVLSRSGTEPAHDAGSRVQSDVNSARGSRTWHRRRGASTRTRRSLTAITFVRPVHVFGSDQARRHNAHFHCIRKGKACLLSLRRRIKILYNIGFFVCD